MSVKRYSAGDIAVATRKGNINVDDQYIRVDHALAAGVLVPVPDGEACAADDARNNHTFIMRGGEVFMSEPHLWDWERLDGTYAELNDDIFVQPVRLVRLEDVG